MLVNLLTAERMAMTRRNLALALTLVLSLEVAKASPAIADEFAACLGEAAKADLAGKTAYQSGLRDLIVERRPGFTRLADINRDLQILFAEMRFAGLDYLLSTAPERLESTSGLSKLRNFDWTEEDVRRLTESSPDYRAQVARLEVLKAQNQGHPEWPDMRAFVKSQMSEGGALSELTMDFVEHKAAMEARLSACQKP